MSTMTATTPQRVPCSQCGTDLRLSTTAMTVELDVPASGRGSVRVLAHTLTRGAWDEEGLLVWEAPCCTSPDGSGYIDSVDTNELDRLDPWSG